MTLLKNLDFASIKNHEAIDDNSFMKELTDSVKVQITNHFDPH